MTDHYVKLSNGMQMHKIGLGTWKAEKNVTKEVVYEALKCGYKHIDCAPIYGNEKEIGEAFVQAFKENICRREDIWVTSKLWNTDHRRENVKAACEKTLSDLNLKYLDLYLIHFPISLKHVSLNECASNVWVHPDTKKMEIDAVSAQETWEAMEELVNCGLVKNIGVSNFNCQLLQDLLKYAKIKPVVNQVESHPYLTQEKLIKFCDLHNISVTAYSPFGGISYEPFGMWNESEPQPLKESLILSMAEKYNKSPAQIILRWEIQRANNVTVLAKTSNKTRLAKNLDIFNFKLDDAEMQAISKLNMNKHYNDPGVYAEKLFGCFWPIFD